MALAEVGDIKSSVFAKPVQGAQFQIYLGILEDAFKRAKHAPQHLVTQTSQKNTNTLKQREKITCLQRP